MTHPENDAPSGRIYALVTRHWPHVAGALILAAGVGEVVFGTNTPGFTVGFYIFAWATATGGMWFLFDVAERALSIESRAKVVAWLSETDLRSGIASIPDQFSMLFDEVFGEHHFSRKCALGAFTASMASASLVGIVYLALKGDELTQIATSLELGRSAWHLYALAFITTYMFALLFNVMPDYLSLLETRWAIGRMRGGRLVPWLLFDLVLTVAISSAAILVGTWIAGRAGAIGTVTEFDAWAILRSAATFGPTPDGLQAIEYLDFDFNIRAVYFYSAFFTSAWLWLYALSVPISQFLLRMNSGVGFLLQVSDVEAQPFRSLGFVMVVILTGLFILGLPLLFL